MMSDLPSDKLETQADARLLLQETFKSPIENCRSGTLPLIPGADKLDLEERQEGEGRDGDSKGEGRACETETRGSIGGRRLRGR
eukprot:1890508-Rhodomonas_salina.2